LLSLKPLAPLRAFSLAFALLFAGPARGALPAPPDAVAPADVEVDEHVAQGHRLYLLGRYQDAIGEYRRAYELRADPQFLFQIAEAYRQLGATEQALFYYERYLAGAAAGPDRAVAEQHVAEIESLRAAPPPPGPSAGLAAAPGGTAGPTAKRPTPIWRRWWLWTAIGVALAAGATAAALAGRSETSTPSTDLGDKKFF
jgi:tetratricopeptide (TPR) repeat protein